MKRKKISPVAKTFAVLLVGLTAFNSCKKSDQANEIPQQFVGDWKLSDLMLVSAGDKQSRKLKELPMLNDLRFILSPDGKVSDGRDGTGNWEVSRDRLLIRFDGEEVLDLKVAKLDPGFMVLEHHELATPGDEGGTVYFAFAK